MKTPYKAGQDTSLLKLRARRLKSALSTSFSIELTYSNCLELIAREEGYRNWDTASAQSAPPGTKERTPVTNTPMPVDVPDPNVATPNPIATMFSDYLVANIEPKARNMWNERAEFLRKTISDCCNELGWAIPREWPKIDIATIEEIWNQPKLSDPNRENLTALIRDIPYLKGAFNQPIDSGTALKNRALAEMQLGYVTISVTDDEVTSV